MEPIHAGLRGERSQLLRFVAVGVVNTAFSYAIYAVLVFLGLNFALANFVSIAIGIVFSFKTQGALVFGHADNRRIGRFALAWAILYGVNVFIISRFIGMGLGVYASGLLALPFVTLLSYLAQRFFVFRRCRTAA